MSKYTLVRLFDATIDVAPESIMLSAPDSIREIYDAPWCSH